MKTASRIQPKRQKCLLCIASDQKRNRTIASKSAYWTKNQNPVRSKNRPHFT